jgi:hypothetical protein
MITSRYDHSGNIIIGKNDKIKPDLGFDYNNAKKGMDLSDHMGSYYTMLKKTLKWCIKIVIELICSTFIVNAWFIHRKWGNIKCRNVVLQRNYYRWFNKRC